MGKGDQNGKQNVSLLDLQNEYVIQIVSFFRNVGYID